MNPHDIASNSPAAAPASSGSISGQARVEHIGTDPGAHAGADTRTQAPWGTAKPAATRFPNNTLLGDYVGRALGFVSEQLSPSRVQGTLGLAKRWGHYAVLAGGALTLAYAIVEGIRSNSFSVFATGLALVAALAVAQYAAMRFIDAADTLIASTPSRVSSSAFLECLGLLLVLFAVSSVLGGAWGAIELRSIAPLVSALFTGVVFVTLGGLALHPGMVNNHPGSGTAGEEAIGLLSFAAKAGLKVAPLAFALLGAAGSLAVLWSFFTKGGTFANTVNAVISGLPFINQVVRLDEGQMGSALIIFACLVPMLAYAGFLMQHLAIDLLRAVLSLPGKLDALRR